MSRNAGVAGDRIVHGVYEHDWSLILGMAASPLTCGSVAGLTVFYRLKRLRAARQSA